MTAPTATWGQLHVGDTVRGADQRPWQVVGRELGSDPWIGSGVVEDVFTLQLGDRTVTVRRPVGDPAPLVVRADHTEAAAVFAALIDAGLSPALLEESVSAPAPDPFASAAAPPKLDRWNRYVLPDPITGEERAWTRATTVAKALSDEYHLTQWKLRMVAKGMSQRPDLIAGAAAADLDEDKGTLNKIAEQAMDRAGSGTGANLGTALHSFTHRLDRGEAMSSLGAPAPLDKDLAAYVAALGAHRLRIRPEWIERIVVVPELGIAGTLDRIVEQPTSYAAAAPLTVLDLKSQKTMDFGGLEIAIQQAIYTRATHVWDPATRTYQPMPPVDQDRALVLHLPVGQARGQVYGVNLIEGWAAVQLAMQVRAARTAGKGYVWLVNPEPEELATHRVARAADQAELAALWDNLHPRGLWTDEVNAAAAARWDQLYGNQTAA